MRLTPERAVTANASSIEAALRLAAFLWLLFAFVVWNVVFDRILVIEGRAYVYAAAVAVSKPRRTCSRARGCAPPSRVRCGPRLPRPAAC